MAHLIFKAQTVLQLTDHSENITDLSDHQDVMIFFFPVSIVGKLSST